MSFFFVQPDPPDSVMYAAKSFALSEVKRLEALLTNARAALEAVQDIEDEAYETVGPSNWADPIHTKVERLQEEVEKYEKLVANAHLKLYWEGQRQFNRKIKVHPKQMPTPWKDDPNNWAKWFKRRTA